MNFNFDLNRIQEVTENVLKQYYSCFDTNRAVEIADDIEPSMESAYDCLHYSCNEDYKY